MRLLIRLLKSTAFVAVLLTGSGCCCWDPGALEEYGVGEKFSEEIEARMQEEAAKLETATKQAEAEAAKMKAEAAQLEKQAAKVEVKAAEPTKKAIGDVGGSFKDGDLDKKELTGGSLKLEVDGKSRKISGRFLGQYYRKPFSIPFEGKLTPSGGFELKGKDARDSDITLSGTHQGDALVGKITGKVRGKAIVADVSAQRAD